MTQTFDRWLAVPDVVKPFEGISVISHGDGVTSLYLHAGGRDLKITFKQIWALTIHEEFGHPSVDDQVDLPRLNTSANTYPLLIVTNSEWLESFSETRLASIRGTPIHYQFISMSYIVDVLSYLRPDVKWVDQAPIEECGPILRDAGA